MIHIMRPHIAPNPIILIPILEFLPLRIPIILQIDRIERQPTSLDFLPIIIRSPPPASNLILQMLIPPVLIPLQLRLDTLPPPGLPLELLESPLFDFGLFLEALFLAFVFVDGGEVFLEALQGWVRRIRYSRCSGGSRRPNRRSGWRRQCPLS
jgi:hypothetical protein